MEFLIAHTALAEEEILQNKPDYITEARWKIITGLRSLEDKKRSLLAGKLLYRMQEACGIQNPVYGTEKNGKPVLLSHPQWAFNISHSGEYVVLAYKKNIRSIGVDIQQIKEFSEGAKKRILHEKERFYFQNGNREDINRIWAIKESYVKMTGVGLSCDFRDLYIDFTNKTVTDKEGKRVPFRELAVPKGYVAAVVIEK